MRIPKRFILRYTTLLVFQLLNISRNSRMRDIQETGKKIRILALFTNAKREFRYFVVLCPSH